ncbi:uncharacterized protein LOC121915986 [Sceloporus undulatus]|uniref:uncharacterized protein LOC121915986 n=1 Tax=Sceloporus undulatus TaxID=8520 RepID=UPI001C4C7C6C|nr:uncharacterized protein LOC121915986 [Sceloporus undulatus]
MVPLEPDVEARQCHHFKAQRSISTWLSERGLSSLSGFVAIISIPCIFKSIHYIIACVNFLLLVIIGASPYWLVHPSGEREFVMGFWTYCFQYKCDVVFRSSEHLTIARILLVAAILSSLTSLVSSRTILMRCVQKNIREGLISFLANVTTGTCVLGCLLLVTKKLRYMTEEDKTVYLSLYTDFTLGCIVCAVCYVLGISSLLWYRYQVFLDKKLGIQVIPVQQLEVVPSLFQVPQGIYGSS